MITMLYGFMGALTVYLIQKYYEMKHDETDNINIEKPKEGFLILSLIIYDQFRQKPLNDFYPLLFFWLILFDHQKLTSDP